MRGEIGLDHRFVTDERHYPAQRQVVAWFLDRARAQGKLVSVHRVRAEHDTAEMLSRYDDIRRSSTGTPAPSTR